MRYNASPISLSSGLALTVKTKVNIPVFALIRPRGGDFLYTDDEFQVMKMDVIAMCEGGIDGIVMGLLRKYAALIKLTMPQKFYIESLKLYMATEAAFIPMLDVAAWV